MSRATSTTPLDQSETALPPVTISAGKWMVLLAAFLGWMFDGLEMGIFPLVARPALQSMLATTVPADRLADEIRKWHGIIDALFLLGAASGGLVFGWLGDRIGRVRAMSISILVYSLFTGLCYFAQSPLQIGLLRFVSAVGMGGEWSLGVALVMEVWEAKRRPLLAGLIGAASNVGFLTIAVAGLIVPVTQVSWRWVMLTGALPALLTFFIRIFVPESQKWRHSQEQGGRSRPIRELFSGNLVGVTLLAIAFASIALIGTWGSVQKIPAWVGELKNVPGPGAKATAQILSSLGAIVGCLIAPMLAAVLNRRVAYFLLCLASLVSCQVLFRTIDSYGAAFLTMVLLTGASTAAFYGWLPLYLPELFPTRVRATAQGIGYNFGRILAAAGAAWGGTVGGSYARMGAIVSLIYLAGMLAIWAAPETKGRALPS